MKYRAMIETFLDVEADSEEEAIEKAKEQAKKEIDSGEIHILVWEDE